MAAGLYRVRRGRGVHAVPGRSLTVTVRHFDGRTKSRFVGFSSEEAAEDWIRELTERCSELDREQFSIRGRRLA